MLPKLSDSRTFSPFANGRVKAVSAKVLSSVHCSSEASTTEPGQSGELDLTLFNVFPLRLGVRTFSPLVSRE